MALKPQARGFALAALVLFICACTPPDPAPPPEPGTLEAAALALRTGDVPGLREHLGKGGGLAAHARDLAGTLDTEGWLVALGAVEREYDLPGAAEAMRADDDDALAAALGFGPQALRQDVLRGGGSIHMKRADARNFYETGPQPIGLIDGIQPPGLPPGCMAIHVALWGRVEGKALRVRYGYGTRGLTNLEAETELGRTEFTLPDWVQRYADAGQALPRTGPCAGLDVSCLMDDRWYGAEFITLGREGDIQRVLLARDGGWGVSETRHTTLTQRLEQLRDGRLAVIRRTTLELWRTDARWPGSLAELNLQKRELCNPVPDPWAEFQESPAPGFELARNPQAGWYAAAMRTTPDGRRAITDDGRLVWID